MSGRGCYVRAMVTIIFLLCVLPLAAFGYTLFRLRRMSFQIKSDGAFAEIDGVRIHYHFFPVGEEDLHTPTLVFLHGASGNAYDMRLAFLEALKGKYSLLFVDRPGLGFSGGKSGTHDLPSGQADVIATLLERLEIEKSIVVGHSFAGSVTAALGLCAPKRVKGLVFLAPVSHPWPGGVNWYYFVASWPLIGPAFCWTFTLPIGNLLASAAMTNVFLPDQPPGNYDAEIRLPLLFRPASFRANANQIVHLNAAVADQSKRYCEINQPSLVVTGTEDTVVWPSIHCEGLLRDLPQAQLMCLDHAGHMPHHTHTDMIVKGIERLVHKIEGKEEVPSAERRSCDPVVKI